MKNKILLLLFVLPLVTSCVKTKELNVPEDLKGWFVDEDKSQFTMVDENGISQEFRISSVGQSMLPGDSYFMFVHTDSYLNENLYQSGTISYFEGLALNLCVTEYLKDTYFCLTLFDVAFTIPYSEGEFHTDSGNLFFTDNTLNGSQSTFRVEFLDSHEVNGVVYHDVMHVMVTDFDFYHRPYFPSEFYYAKHYGPIEYVLGGKVRAKRAACEF